MLNMPKVLNAIAPLLGLGAILIGAAAAAFPKLGALGFGIPTAATGLSYVRTTGIRDVFIGWTILVLWHAGDLHALSLIILALAAIAIVDFLLTFINGSRLTSAVHLGGVLVLSLYGFWLFSQN